MVIKHNALVNASYRLSLAEQRLVLLSIVEARRVGANITPMDRLTVSADIYARAFNITRQASYMALKEACENLFNREYGYIEILNKGVRVVRSRWVSEIAYNEQQATVDLIFAPSIVPYITNLEQQFTSYDLEQVAELNSKYSVRLYEIIIAWKGNGKTNQISIEKLRERLGVADDEYQKMELFKRRILDKSLLEINQKTNITLSYEQHKQGRKIIGFTFTIKQKPNTKQKKTKDDETRDLNTVDLLSPIKMTDKQRAIFASKLAYEPELEKYAQGDLNHYGRLAEWIKQDLLDPNRVNFYRPILERLGFVEW